MTLTSPKVSTASITKALNDEYVGRRVVGSVGRRDADDRLQEPGGQGGADQLDDDVAGHPPPREVPAQREGDADRRVEVGAGDLAHEQDDAHHHQRRVRSRRPSG